MITSILTAFALLISFITAAFLLHFITLIVYFTREINGHEKPLWAGQEGRALIVIILMASILFLGIMLSATCTLGLKQLIPTTSFFSLMCFFALSILLVSVLFVFSIETGQKKGKARGKKYSNYLDAKKRKLTTSDWFAILSG